MRKYIAEFIGTFVLVAFGCGSAVAANSIFISMGSPLPIAFTTLLIAFAFGLSIVAMAYSIGNISGCHINPAVSLGMLITGRMNVKDFCGYVVGQLAGAVVAALFLMLLFGGRDALGANGYGESSAVGISMMAAAGLEIVMTFVFVLVVLGATSKKEYSPVAGLVIGLSLTLIHIFGIPFTGTSVNPARSFGPAIVSGGDALNQLPVFIVAPLIGGAIAALVFRLLFTAEEGDDAEHAMVDAIADKILAGFAAAEGVLEEAGDVFEESYDAMVRDETGLEEVAKVLDGAGDEFEEAYDKMTGDHSAPVEEAEEAPAEVAEDVTEDATEVQEATEEVVDDRFDETYEMMNAQSMDEAEETAPEVTEEEAETASETEELAEAPAEESVEEEPAAEESAQEEPTVEEPVEEAEAPAEPEAEALSEEGPAEEAAEEAAAEEQAAEEGSEEKSEEHKQSKGHQGRRRRKKNSKHQK